MQTSPSGVFVAFRNDRLGGRLNAILTAMRLAETYGGDFRIFWSLSEESSIELHSPQDLFAQSFIDRHFLPREAGREMVENALDIGALPRQMTEADLRAGLASGRNYLSTSATEQLLLPWEDASALSDLPQIIGRIALNPVVKNAMAQIDLALAGMPFSSYHLRRGDIIDDSTLASHNLWSNKYIPRVIYEWHMKRMLGSGSGRIIVFSDAPREAAAFATLSPRVSDFASLLGDLTLTTLQRDFLELYTMSRSERIIAPPGSAFSRLAATIGTKEVTDIEADLPREDRDAALDALVERLDQTPDVFLSQSDAGQNLPFISDHLRAKGEGARVVAITRKLIAGGMDRAYVYPFLSDHMLMVEDYAGCDALLTHTANRLCQREEQWATVYLNAALADMVRQNWPRAMENFQAGAWLSPLHKSAQQIFWFMAATGRLTTENSLPYDSHLLRPAGRIFADVTSSTHAKLVQALREEGLSPQVYPANMEVRDWRKLSGKKLSFRFSNKAKIRQQAEMLIEGNLAKRNLSPAREAALHSAIGHLFTEAGDLAQAERHLSQALEMQPDTALYIKRLGEWAMASGKKERGLRLLTEAAQQAGDDPCYQALLALAHQEAKDNASAESLMLPLADRATPLVELQFLIIDMMRRKPALLPEALRRLRRLTTQVPATFRIVTMQAKLFEQMGFWEDSIAALKSMEAMGRPPSVIENKYTGLFKAYRRETNAREARRWFTEHGLTPPELVKPAEG